MKSGFWWAALPWLMTALLLGLLTVQIVVTSQRFTVIEARQGQIIEHVDHFIEPVQKMLDDDKIMAEQNRQGLQILNQLKLDSAAVAQDSAKSTKLWEEHVKGMKDKP